MKLLRGRIKDLITAGLSGSRSGNGSGSGSGYGNGSVYGYGNGSGNGFIKTDKDRYIITKTEVIEVIER